MTLIQKYLKAKGIRVSVMAAELRLGRDTVYKVLAQCQYRTRSGRIRTRATARIRKAIADYLSLPYEVLWGPQASRHLRRLIEEEIDRQVGHSAAKAAMEKSRELRRELLDEAQEQAA